MTTRPLRSAHSLLCLLAAAATFPSRAADPLEAFPPAEGGQVRHVLRLEPHEDEDRLKVELLVGKTVEVDSRNRHFLSGTIETETLEGWGYQRYVAISTGEVGGTLIAVDPSEPKVRKFVAIRNPPLFLRYNSKVPLVVYAAEGFEVRYRLWEAGAEKAVPQG